MTETEIAVVESVGDSKYFFCTVTFPVYDSFSFVEQYVREKVIGIINTFRTLLMAQFTGGRCTNIDYQAVKRT